MTQPVLAVVLGVLFALGTFLVLRRDVVRVVWGVAIMSQAANVYLVTMGGVSPETVAPIVGHGEAAGNVTDPLVQALVLTAIVIGFGTTAFALVLTYRLHQEHGTIDVDDLGGGDWPAPADVTEEGPSTPDDADGLGEGPSPASAGDRPTSASAVGRGVGPRPTSADADVLGEGSTPTGAGGSAGPTGGDDDD